MAEPFSVERRKLMVSLLLLICSYGVRHWFSYIFSSLNLDGKRMLGAKVIVTPKAGKGTGMVEKAKELSEKHGWFLCHQFETEANWKFHYETTVSE